MDFTVANVVLTVVIGIVGSVIASLISTYVLHIGRWITALVALIVALIAMSVYVQQQVLPAQTKDGPKSAATAPTASSPTASSPTTGSPTTGSPTTSSPTTSSPTTSSPTTSSPTNPGPITEVRIDASPDRYVAPSTIESGSPPGFEPYVFTADGRLGRGDECYIKWTVLNNDRTLRSGDRTRCEKQGGFSEAYWPSNLKIRAGSLVVRADVSTGWGASSQAELKLSVVSR